MASTYTTELRIEKIATGEQDGSWGTTTNTQYDMIEAAISGTSTVAFASDGDDTLSTANGSDDEARHAVINLSGGSTLTATRNMVCPTSSKLYIVDNNTTGGQSVVFKTSAGTGITIANGTRAFLYCDGTNVVDAFDVISAITTASLTATGGTITGITDLVVADGGTGVSTLTDGGVLLGSGAGAITATAALADSEFIVGDGSTDPVLESGATLRTSVGVGTGDSPQFTGIELGHATDTTITRASAGDLNLEGNIVYRAGGTDVPVTDGGTGASSLTNGGVLLGSGTGAVTATDVLADGEVIVGDGTTDPVLESGATLRTSIGVGTGDSPQFTGIELGHATDTTITRASGGDLNIEGNIAYRAGGTDVPVTDGGTGVSTLTDGGILLGSGTSAVTAMSVLADGAIVIGDGSTDPVALSAFSSSTGTLKVANGGTGAATLTNGGVLLGSGTGAITATAVLADGEMVVGDGTTDPVLESGATLRTSIGLGTASTVQFAGTTVSSFNATGLADFDAVVDINNNAASRLVIPVGANKWAT